MGLTPMEALAGGQGGRLQELLGMAGEEARSLGHHFVGTGHVALAALRMSVEDESSVVGARSRLEELLGRGSAQADDQLQPTPRLIQLVEECRATSGADDADASNVLTAIRRLEPAVARTVLAE
jgi:ATP-dependent Clp protease ATP-binding subunit ClpA